MNYSIKILVEEELIFRDRGDLWRRIGAAGGVHDPEAFEATCREQDEIHAQLVKAIAVLRAEEARCSIVVHPW